MDSIIKFDEISYPQVAIYTILSFLIVTILGALIYITCSKKYKLNWFEKNLLETAKEREALRQSQEALVESAVPFNTEPFAGSLRSLNRNGSPTSVDDPTFWVPPTLQKQSSLVGDVQSSADESMPQTPSSPTSSNKSIPLSVASVPIARTDKHVVLTSTSPARPKTHRSSMQAKLDHTKIDTSLYKSPKESPSKIMPVPEETKGGVHLTILYDPAAGLLTVKLIEAQNLQPREFSGTADPYAKIRLLPDKSTTFQTKIHKKTLDPVFDEDFVFEVRPATISRRVIEIMMFDFDAYSRHVCIGGLTIALAHIDLSDRVDLWKQLGSCEQDLKAELGDLMVSLSYLPSAERLTVVVIKARNLRVVDDTRNSSDPFVKVSLVHNNKRLKKKKTTVFRNTVNPVFNEAFSFDVSKDMLKNSLIEFLVLHDSLLGANELLGRAVIGNKPDIRHEEKVFFDEMFRTKTAIAQWIPLSDPKAEQHR